MQLMVDVTITVEIGSPTPVYGNHKGPESDPAMMRTSNNQNLFFRNGLGTG